MTTTDERTAVDESLLEVVLPRGEPVQAKRLAEQVVHFDVPIDEVVEQLTAAIVAGLVVA